MLNAGSASEYDQLGVQQGINRHGEVAVVAVIWEYEQLKDDDTVDAVYADELSRQQKWDALELLTL